MKFCQGHFNKLQVIKLQMETKTYYKLIFNVCNATILKTKQNKHFRIKLQA